MAESIHSQWQVAIIRFTDTHGRMRYNVGIVNLEAARRTPIVLGPWISPAQAVEAACALICERLAAGE